MGAGKFAEDGSPVPEAIVQGFIWRDCKPENILVSGKGRGRVMLADFGLSIDATEERPVTRAGTLDYMAPEVCNHSRAWSKHMDAVDMFASDSLTAGVLICKWV